MHVRENYEQWRSLPERSGERELAMKKAFYDWALRNLGAVHFAQELITHMLQSDTVPGREERR
jgi:hypothetical protein